MCASPGARCLLAPDACEWRPSTAMPCKACPCPRLPLLSKGLGWKCGQKTKNLHCFVVRFGGGRLKAGVRAAWHADIATLDDLSRAATAHLSHSPPHRSCRPRYLGQRARGLAGGNAGRAITLVRGRGDDGDEPEAGVHDAGTLEERARLRAALAMAGAGAAAPRASKRMCMCMSRWIHVGLQSALHMVASSAIHGCSSTTRTARSASISSRAAPRQTTGRPVLRRPFRGEP